ncbi:MAG: antibiotic biosynthesis monooxygenase [Oscillospiraceae bacterium]|jgi:quinol monooxygenase YgiN|nr:antibiotic biosynthesis monooxygenase [Oscillospiraceae bacterium]
MITIVAKNIVKPGEAEAFKRTVQPLIAASQAEAGCIAYNLYEDVTDPNTLTFIEQWRDEAAIAEHNASAHFTGIVPLLAGYAAAEGEVRLYKLV